jgi:hypothetical protein
MPDARTDKSIAKCTATQKRKKHPWRVKPGTSSPKGAELSAKFAERDAKNKVLS